MKKLIVTAALISTLATGTAFAQSANAPAASSAVDTTTGSTTVSTIPNLTADEMASSKIVGAAVYNTNNDKIGSVSDLVLDSNGKVVAVVVGVGGFLGMGEREIAISYPSVKITKDAKGYEHITVAATKEQLKAMTPYDSKKNG